MTRPMPGPPGGFTDYARLNHAVLDKQITHEQYQEFGAELTRAFTARPKHLTDAEVAAEYWRAEADHTGIRNGEGVGWSSAEVAAALEHEVKVWHRFATHPHADLNGDTND